jgi:hypothetical protein
MSRLPPALRPLWPVVKRGHRALTRTVGAVGRRVPTAPDRALPRRGTVLAAEAAAAEPARVRIRVGSPAFELVRTPAQGTPPGMAFFDEVTDYAVPPRFVLEIDDGRLVGEHAATVTPGGILEWETSHYFGTRTWREHPLYLRPRLPAERRVEGTVLSLVSHGSARNYFHLITDLAPRWGIAQEALPGLEPDHVVVNTDWPAHREILHLLGIDRYPLIQPDRAMNLRADRLLVPGLHGFRGLAPPWVTDWLRDQLPADRTQGRPRRLYVTRGEVPNSRRMVHERGVVEVLEQRGFTRFDPMGWTVQEQIDHFAAAEAVVAPHGAALTNLTFCPPGVRVLEMFAPTYLNPAFWAITANIPDSVYRYLVADPVDLARPERRMNGLMTDIALTPAQVAAAVDALLA